MNLPILSRKHLHNKLIQRQKLLHASDMESDVIVEIVEPIVIDLTQVGRNQMSSFLSHHDL